MLRVRITHINATAGHIFSEYTEPLEEPMTRGEFYRTGVENYGRCTSKVYIDMPGGPPEPIGYVYLSRERYEDTNEPYLRETWCALERVESPTAVSLDRLKELEAS